MIGATAQSNRNTDFQPLHVGSAAATGYFNNMILFLNSTMCKNKHLTCYLQKYIKLDYLSFHPTFSLLTIFY